MTTARHDSGKVIGCDCISANEIADLSFIMNIKIKNDDFTQTVEKKCYVPA